MHSAEFLDALGDNGVTFFAGVPDSYLHGFCTLLRTRCGERENVIAANEGNAIGIACGYHLATGRVPLVYMQNSGLGNAVNPLASLACGGMLGIPMILLVGWRGDPFHRDHVQHALQGEITPKILDVMGIPRRTLAEGGIAGTASWAVSTARELQTPVGILVPKGMLGGRKKPSPGNGYPLSREEAIGVVLDAAPAGTVFSATTGRASRELYNLRESRGEDHGRDFLNVGSMGHASSVALGMALARPERRFICLDGDAAVIMHMGALATAGKIDAPNFLHIVLNNGEHESVGGQPSAGYVADLTAVARACGYATLEGPVSDPEDVADAVGVLCRSGKASFLDIRIHSGIRSDIPGLEVDPKGMRDGLVSTLADDRETNGRL